MNPLARALETSVFLAEKVASARPAGAELREKQALADFATFGLFKRASMDMSPAGPALMKGLGWGVGLGLPALGVGHMLMRDGRHQGEELINHARNQALLTAAGVGGMQSLGEMLKSRMASPPPMQHQMGTPEKLAAAILVDDVLEAACGLADASSKHAALVALIRHRSEAVSMLRGQFEC